MINEQPVIRLVEVELRTPTGGFILGQSHLNIDGLGSGADLTWAPYLADSTSVEAVRGGKRAGVTNTMDVGTMTVSLLNAANPLTNPFVQPNVPVRLRSKGDSEPFFTGTLSDVDMTHEVDKSTGEVFTFVTLVVVDAVQAHANTNRYGAVSPDGYERWESRIARLAASSAVPINAPVVDAPVVKYSL